MTFDTTARHEISTKIGLPAGLGDSARLLGHEDDLDPVQSAEVTRLYAMLEVAFLAAAADGEINDAEADNLGATLASWLGTELSEDTVEGLIERLMEGLAAEGRDARLAAAAGVLDAEQRRTAYALACVVVLCDLELHDRELDALGAIATALELGQEESQRRFEEIQDHVESVVANAAS